MAVSVAHQTFHGSDTQKKQAVNCGERSLTKDFSSNCYKYGNHTAVEQMFLTTALPRGLSSREIMCSQAQRDK